jgi:hypothetical protein
MGAPGAISLFSNIFLLYGIWLVATGSPIWKMRARPVATKPIVLEDVWFRVAGCVLIVEFAASWIFPAIGGFNWIVYLAALLCYLVGLWRALVPRVQ